MSKQIIYLSDYELWVFLLKGKHLIEEAGFQNSRKGGQQKDAAHPT
jgi:hypothetical protein